MDKKVVNLTIDKTAIDDSTKNDLAHERIYVKARSTMPEKQLFDFAVYHEQDAERIGYSEYSYWKSVWRNFLKKKSAVVMLTVFSLLFVFTFVAVAVSKFDVNNLRIDNKLAFTAPNVEFWFGTDNLGRDYWSQVWHATRTSIILAVTVALGQISLGMIIGLVWVHFFFFLLS
jgi:oligopeptide transport system permease protein